VPRFEPFRGVVYNAEGGFVDDVIAPPYDVISPDDRAALVARSDCNAVRLELPTADGAASPYDAAAALWQQWLDERILVPDDEPAFFIYRMGFRDEAGRPRQTTGILGALALEPPGEGIMPHERTTPKDKADRLELLRATRCNLSPIWGLSTTAGLADLLDTPGPPDVRATDADGVHHRMWRITQPGVVAAIREAVAAGSIVVADGHHRYEVALAYQAEAGAGTGGHDFIFAYVVPLAGDEVTVRPIHRLLSNGADASALRAVLERHFDLFEAEPVDATIAARMDDAGALALVLPEECWFLRPKPETVAAAGQDLDSSRLDVALADLPNVEVRFQHGWDLVEAAVKGGTATAGVLLRPATMDQIAAIGRGGERMPPKTTFFYPKLRTGMVFRSLDLS